MSVNVLRFNYHENPALPRLAWCAVAEADSEGVAVHHGVGVETHPGFFVEGAWDGDFGAGRFDKAITFTGTGARLVGNRVIFSSPNHNLERVYSLEKDRMQYLSNTLAFLMVVAKETLDPCYPFYYFDFIRCYRTGLRQTNHCIKTRLGRRIKFHDCHNLQLENARITSRQMRSFGDAPRSYEGYKNTLLGATNSVFRNAADPARRIRYQPLASISKGYDSPATASLSAACGCEEALTFRKSNANKTHDYCDDSGAGIASRLGLLCEEFDRVDLREAKAELLKLHFQNPFGSIVSSMEQASDLLEGRVLVTGRHGEHYWGMDSSRSLPWYQEPTTRKTLVQNTLEFRLDRGYIDFHLPYTCGVYATNLLKISRSTEMAKWRVGGEYDRPVPRRIVETAGVPREQFGRQKMGGADADPARCTFSDQVKEEFMLFYRDYAPENIRVKQHEENRGGFGYHEHGFAYGIDRWLRTQWGLRNISEYVLGFHNHQRRYSPFLYAFHWGFEYVAERYRHAMNHGVKIGHCR